MKKKLRGLLILGILIIGIILISRKFIIKPINDEVTVETGASPSNETEKPYTNDSAQWGVYGTSYKGNELKYYKIGDGSNVLFVVAAQHGWEDAWANDGKEVTKIANDLIDVLDNYSERGLFNKWTIYVLPQANPDGVIYGYSEDGPGRTTLEGYDMNRSYGTSNFTQYTNSRNYTGRQPFLAQETVAIRDLMLKVKTEKSGEIVVIDLHGWLDQTIGTPEIGAFYNEQFYNKNDDSWGKGYLVTWAKEALGAKASLVELPYPKNAQDIIDKDFSGRFVKATLNLLKK